MVESVKRKAIKQDEIDDPGILVPVENILIVDSLREEVQENAILLQEKDAKLQEKDAKLQEKDAQLQEKDALLEKYKRKFGEL
jgi:uncharacterized protein (DUF3084 family)